jgi:hypothetical protein
MDQIVAGERGSDPKKKPAPVRLSGCQFYGRSVRSRSVGFGPGFFAREQSGLIGEAFDRHQALESRQPVFVVARAVVWFPAPGSGLQFLCETGSPLFPGEMPLLRELDCERESLRLPRLGEDWAVFVPRQTRKIG